MLSSGHGHGGLEPVFRLIGEDSLEAFCEEILAPLSRRDQRRWGWMYVRGLLLATGRKTMRNIAATSHRPSSQQNLQQFVSKSTWNWAEVRRQLATILCRRHQATSWIVSPLFIPKAGNNTVGVGTQFVSPLGKLVNCQRAIGVWLASPEMTSPVDWQLVLPPTWSDDAPRRRRAAVPLEVKSATAWGMGLDALVTILNDWRLPVRPVVIDAREAEAAEMVQELRRLNIPFVVRINRLTRLVQAGRGSRSEDSAESLARLMKEQRRMVRCQETEVGRWQGVLAAATRVELPALGPETPLEPRTLILIAEWRDSVQGRPSLWLSNITRMSVSALLDCANLARQVYQDQEQISRRVGLYDFEGRSFGGWHRHFTLVSAAHAFLVLNCLHTSFRQAQETRRDCPWRES